MRILALSLLLVLSGCAAAPQETPQTQIETQVTSAPEETASEAETEVASPEPTETESQQPATEPTETPKESVQPAPSPTKTAKPIPSPTQSAPKETAKPAGYTAADVAAKNSRSACWVIISGSVYNLTEWINKHPGGSGAISSLCGTDGTDAFEGKHGGEARASSTLDSYYLGPLIP